MEKDLEKFIELITMELSAMCSAFKEYDRDEQLKILVGYQIQYIDRFQSVFDEFYKQSEAGDIDDEEATYLQGMLDMHKLYAGLIYSMKDMVSEYLTGKDDNKIVS